MNRTQHITSWALILLLMLTVPAFYVASMGPASRWGDHRTVNLVYWPLIAGCDATPLERPLCAWIEWWHSGGNQGHQTVFADGRVIRWLSHIE